ncbi:hypothetical protein FIV42_11735 [Persicimonas caeni]|uniref:Uncharacterized protein n=1 Tax=Persicimonas caeni TaxID=2292766 RepID=A0A4Y6PSS2_PERCE|nr:hypothetical protein [Persicimonas caeni]QDG51386.1 hypothetical protein FIV42_11735 [Persicimonas caeni]QED32607.1 hypothetical protein FRD00_11730 [Persicimonas caeni]
MGARLVVGLCSVLLLASLGCDDGGSSGGDGELVDVATSDAADTTAADVSEDVLADTQADVQADAATLSERYPGDEGMAEDSAVLFFDDFEAGWGRWDAPQADTQYLTMQDDAAVAHSGSGYLRSTVTTEDLANDQYISSASRVGFERVDEIYWRFYARFPHVAPNPHHWVRVSAGNASWNSSGLANTVPPGDEGFWFDFDINNDNVFNFYVYWHEMRSGRCNDGTAEPGCAGDQGTTYHYGNTFRPPGQQPYPLDEWVCIEMRAKANTPGQMDGELAFWVDGEPVGEYRAGHPEGTWLRDQFHTDGCDWSACGEPEPFEGFNFRTSEEVGFKRVILDAYYERGSSARKQQALEDRGLTVSDEQTILYDDVVVATERIGCRR